MICCRAIELHRDNQLVLHAKKADNEKTVPIIPVTIPMVNRAAAEYRENPMMLATGSACDLDKAILIGMCKYAKSTGISEMFVEEIWERCNDTISAYGRQASSGALEAPPWPVFEDALQRLVSQGLIMLISKSGAMAPVNTTNSRKSTWTIDEAVFAPRLIHSDIIAALRDAKDPMCRAAWPT
mmetsp:Transcript_8442/g.12583  ORF Transcript_8442/g.12583 Transcript_8442/m.12583 type:complete len:183 (+) Transcript_8442:1522-2070(+)